ncbi:MAG: alpha/beta hydrolase [Actinobacteria bacterium]|nr:alpha/beta hydrolase [Actinomycetota bacterium]
MARMTPEQLVERLRSFPKAGPEVTWEQRRAGMDRASAKAPLPEGTTVTAVDADGVPGEWITSSAGSDGPATLYLHGGGYTMGSFVTHRALAANLAAATRGPVLLIEYRLAPEHPCPAAIDDTRTAWRYLLAQPGVDVARTAIGGDSAGGGLTAATLLALRAHGDPLPGCAVLLSPWVDMTLEAASLQTLADADPMVDQLTLSMSADAYAGSLDRRDPAVSPLFGDWAAMPPMLVQVGELEVLLDDARALAERVTAAGGSVTLEEWAGMVHVWQSFCGMIEDADRAVTRLGEFIRSSTGA